MTENRGPATGPTALPPETAAVTDEVAMLFDLDGTLIDSVYQHVLSWRDALEEEGIDLPVWRIHRKIGMSGGLFARALLRETGLPLESERLQRLQHRHEEIFGRYSPGVRPLPGAKELLSQLTTMRVPGPSPPAAVSPG